MIGKKYSIAATISALAFAMTPGLVQALDQSVGPIYPIADTYVSSAHPNTNYGTSVRLWSQNDTEQNYSLLKFDLTSAVDTDGNNPCTQYVGTPGGSMYMKVDAVSDGGHNAWLGETSTWTETGVTWNNMPAIRTINSNPILLTDYPTLSTQEDSVNDWTTFSLLDSISNACAYNSGILTVIVKDGSTDAVAWRSSRASSNTPYAYFTVGD
ncbi:MAG TPA: DNRLRE domain-containing protein [Patescibacteria group bacterium]|nr:DNRLRE domain-containing protein [Patescibacteria group bacterium]